MSSTNLLNMEIYLDVVECIKSMVDQVEMIVAEEENKKPKESGLSTSRRVYKPNKTNAKKIQKQKKIIWLNYLKNHRFDLIPRTITSATRRPILSPKPAANFFSQLLRFENPIRKIFQTTSLSDFLLKCIPLNNPDESMTRLSLIFRLDFFQVLDLFVLLELGFKLLTVPSFTEDFYDSSTEEIEQHQHQDSTRLVGSYDFYQSTQRTQPFFLATQIFQVQATQFIQTQYQPTMINDIDDEPIVPTFLITDNFESAQFDENVKQTSVEIEEKNRMERAKTEKRKICLSDRQRFIDFVPLMFTYLNKQPTQFAQQQQQHQQIKPTQATQIRSDMASQIRQQQSAPIKRRPFMRIGLSKKQKTDSLHSSFKH